MAGGPAAGDATPSCGCPHGAGATGATPQVHLVRARIRTPVALAGGKSHSPFFTYLTAHVSSQSFFQFDDEANEVIGDFYLKLRREQHAHDGVSLTPIILICHTPFSPSTTRQFCSLGAHHPSDARIAREARRGARQRRRPGGARHRPAARRPTHGAAEDAAAAARRRTAAAARRVVVPLAAARVRGPPPRAYSTRSARSSTMRRIRRNLPFSLWLSSRVPLSRLGCRAAGTILRISLMR